MIDEAASVLGRDPVAFRKANLLKTGGKTMVGNVVAGALRSREVLDRLGSKPIWTGRITERTRRAARPRISALAPPTPRRPSSSMETMGGESGFLPCAQ
jgi:CO/xanthine dehydrogenase Mo-binding subunit